ncbi:MAG TPA: hypothetical protein V6C65_32170 [Allocoleopsis sp.]
MRSYFLNRSILTFVSIAATVISPAITLAQSPEPTLTPAPPQTQTPTPTPSPVQSPPPDPTQPSEPRLIPNSEINSSETNSSETNSSETNSTVPPGYQLVMGEGWSFAVPADWQTVPAAELPDMGTIRILARLSDSQQQMIVNLITESYEESREEYLKRSIAELGDLGFKVNQQHPITVGTLSGSELDVSVPDANPPVRLLQRIVADENGTGFVMTCGSPDANFATAQTVCATILNSFQVAP